MHRLYAVLLLCLGCASGAPTAYNQSAFRSPPRAPAFNPVEDAPHTFRPGQPRPTVEPQPTPKRYLPQTEETRREAGLWAAGTPPSITPTMPLLYGVALPYPEVEDKIDRATTDFCAYAMMARSADPGMPKEPWKAWDVDTRRCLAATLYLHCAKRMVEYYDAHVEMMIAMDKSHERMVNLTSEKARDFERKACRKTLPDQVSEYMDMVRERFDAEHDRQLSKLRNR